MRRSRLRFNLGKFVFATVAAIVLLLLIFLFRPSVISESEAIRRAEQFIAANGYIDLDADRSHLTSESVVLSSSVEEELEMRHDTLESKADGVFGGSGGWIVYFRSKNRWQIGPETPRAVVMGPKGERIHVIHQDAY